MEQRQDRTGQGERQRGSVGVPMGITDFLLARIAEDEEQAEVCKTLGWAPAKKYGLTAIGPVRVLAECAAKRAIIEMHDPDNYETDLYVSEPLLCTLAAVYSDHPDYRQEWVA